MRVIALVIKVAIMPPQKFILAYNSSHLLLDLYDVCAVMIDNQYVVPMIHLVKLLDPCDVQPHAVESAPSSCRCVSPFSLRTNKIACRAIMV